MVGRQARLQKNGLVQLPEVARQPTAHGRGDLSTAKRPARVNLRVGALACFGSSDLVYLFIKVLWLGG